jgi:hypothetical protein
MRKICIIINLKRHLSFEEINSILFWSLFFKKWLKQIFQIWKVAWDSNIFHSNSYPFFLSSHLRYSLFIVFTVKFYLPFALALIQAWLLEVYELVLHYSFKVNHGEILPAIFQLSLIVFTILPHHLLSFFIKRNPVSFILRIIYAKYFPYIQLLINLMKEKD